MDNIYVIMNDNGDVVKASLNRQDLEAICEEYAYKMRAQAIKDLGQDGDGNEKDLYEAEIYAGQNYAVWSVGWVPKELCDEISDEDVTVTVDNFGEIEVLISDILEALNSDYDEEDYDEEDYDEENYDEDF